ncbi:hypothetical protein [Sporosarcina jiandibaonis]|uniref:hypothetical protein n=1 Tax=Sporosarcina jiandibaonis TaxID=2715535 RepID=UPI001C12F1E0|nr:hypothetical protein [Sporosarcina jiandibaonis]
MRNDKKRDIKPTVTRELKDCIYRLSFITDTPVKDVIEEILIAGSQRRKVVSYLSQYFLRDVRIANTLYMGDLNRIPIKKRASTGRNERVSTRVTESMHDSLSALAYAMGCSVSKACALLVDATVRDTDFVNEFAKGYIEKNVDEERMRELKKVLKYINAGNPFDERISWAALLSHLLEEVQVHAEKVQDTVSEFVINHWKK